MGGAPQEYRHVSISYEGAGTWLSVMSAANNLSSLRRPPSQVRKYHDWIQETRIIHGSVSDYLCKVRLQWQPLSPQAQLHSTSTFAYNNPIPFVDVEDWKILRNDWPYGLEKGITHLVIWSKTPIAVNAETGDLTDHSRAVIQSFIDQVFVRTLSALADAPDRVLWFKNWATLQSIRSMEHIHVMIRDVPEEIIKSWVSSGG